MSLATGQISIIDYNDALTLTGFIGSNHPKTQMFNPDNGGYTPNWGTTNLILTPSLYKLGLTTDIIATVEVMTVRWFETIGGTAITANANYALSGTKSHILTIKTNMLASLPAKDWICEIVYRDPTTGMDLTHRMEIGFSRVINGGGIADAMVTTPLGNVFKNSEVTSLTAQCVLWRGSVVDTTSVTYQWYQQDSSIVADQGGGIGWKKLLEVANATTGVTSSTVTIFSAAVKSYGVFKCLARDTDAASNTFNQTFIDTASFIDNSDPIQVSVLSSGGDVFKNGVGSTTLTARLFQAGNEVDVPGTKYTYKWFKYNKDGVLDVNFGGVGINFKSGKTLAVGSVDVDVKASFSVEVD